VKFHTKVTGIAQGVLQMMQKRAFVSPMQHGLLAEETVDMNRCATAYSHVLKVKRQGIRVIKCTAGISMQVVMAA